MRIIAGEMKGRRLKTPDDSRVRPTTDKVKEAIFSMIAPYLYGSTVIDLFAGTGNLGLEAISRGAAHVYFADKDRRSISLIRENIDYCRAGERAEVIWADYRDALMKIKDTADIIFLDPPYQAGYLEDALTSIASGEVLNEGGIVVAEHPATQQIPDSFEGLAKIKAKKYGKIAVSIYESTVMSDEA